jgi:hypothetical protein
VQPLRTEAKWLFPEPSTGRSDASSSDIASLLERFGEPIRNGDSPASIAAKPALAGSGLRAVQPDDANGMAQSRALESVAAPATTKKSRLTVKSLVAALAAIVLVPTAIFAVLVWQDRIHPLGGHEVAPADQSASLPGSTGLAHPEQASSPLEVVLSSPDRIEAKAGEVIEFPIAIDATEALPPRSILAITALPEGASFSEGRPYGVTGWSLRPDEIGGLRLQLPQRSAASDMHLELVAGDGAVLAQSETRLSIAPAEVATGSIESVPPDEIAKSAEAVADAPPLPQRNPSASAGTDPSVKVNTVKVVTIEPPRQARPHDGAYALGSAADEATAPAEWMQTKAAVDMHAKAQQSSETVKVADKGVTLRVTARDKNWVQVTDPASSTTGWIYNRFLTPAEPPAQ